MFTHLLLPTDGSKLSEAAIQKASHGRRGVSGLLICSETQKVLTHTRIPVLVYR
jgi:nucleotide-binding universal stress UspA family protein